MKKTLLHLLIISTTFFSTSCSKDDDNPNPNVGNWSGTIDGGFVGTWTGKILPNGNFIGKVITNPTDSDYDFNLSGQVNQNGDLVGTMKNITFNITTDFVGSFQSTTGSGTWIYNGAGMDGTWNATKD
jgi:hypothetical protein